MFVTFIFSTNGETHYGKIIYDPNQKITYDLVKTDALYVLNIIDKTNGFDYLPYNEFSIGILGISEININNINNINEAKNFRIYIDKSNNIYNYYFNNTLIKIINTYESELESELESETESESESELESESESELD